MWEEMGDEEGVLGAEESEGDKDTAGEGREVGGDEGGEEEGDLQTPSRAAMLREKDRDEAWLEETYGREGTAVGEAGGETLEARAAVVAAGWDDAVLEEWERGREGDREMTGGLGGNEAGTGRQEGRQAGTGTGGGKGAQSAGEQEGAGSETTRGGKERQADGGEDRGTSGGAGEANQGGERGGTSGSGAGPSKGRQRYLEKRRKR